MYKDGDICMFSNNIIDIIEKYQTNNESTINNINKNIQEIICCLELINENIAEQVRKLLIDKNTNNNAEELLYDSKSLRKYINSIKFLNDKFDTIPLIDIYSVIVLSNTSRCSSEHKTKDIIAKIPVISSDGEFKYYEINASYCFNCKRFTILKEDFKNIKDVIMCKIIDETKEIEQEDDNEFEIEQNKSLLYNYGYNVQTKTNLSVEQRQIILSSVIEAQIMDKRDIVNHINILIDRGSKIPSWHLATQKWKDDKQFVNEYKSGDLPQVIFDNIILRYHSY